MEAISYREFLTALEGYGTAVHCEMYANNYTQYYSDTAPGENIRYGRDRGCVIRADEYDYDGKRWICRYVHQVSPDADIDAAAAEQLADAVECAKPYDAALLNVIAFTVSCGALPPEKDVLGGWRNFSRMGDVVTPDLRVRILTEADTDRIRAACAPSLADGGDTRVGNRLAETFCDYDFAYAAGKYTLYGIFEGDTLAGMASASYEPGIDLAWLRDIFIVPAYREKGLGKALVSSALSPYPDKKWHYQAAKWNTPSIALAKSLGFTLEGAGLYLDIPN
ncbi:MAG: GNAT family N-acetyltransferase [Clostridia bacterium]|nr:GNAT family N-acetyltransferase [Clostridia bacterium]